MPRTPKARVPMAQHIRPINQCPHSAMTHAAWSRENNIARLGRPWEFVRQAGVNRIFPPLRHADARGMFRAFGEGFIRLVLLER